MVADLQRYWELGLKSPAIAARLGKTPTAIIAKIRALRNQGVAMARRHGKRDDDEYYQSSQAGQRGRRRCRFCLEEFDSSHFGNRICGRCLETAPFTGGLV